MSRKDKFLRKCIGCDQFKKKIELIRIMKENITTDIIVNPSTKTFGRSVYICNDSNCVENAFKKMKISKFLKKKVDLDVKEKIKTVLEK